MKIDPPGVYADLAHEAAGAHARGHAPGGIVHLQVEQAGGHGACDGGGEDGGQPDFGVLDNVGHLKHGGVR